ncbi:alpha/beta fold hydrolase [Cupriavidus basilensis]|uniref:Alpha/beta fold hydrolase n=1 Tax=Cupriavidus basilensis TaxID=68895 RepID=A0ABT6ALE1_9BURK|nr:alpha/beta fold hydrolase [Cupriavidus basilensis]MDF3833410.1 alpha/beta fold hydrolase [Cupriavidus basilensis]
MNAPTPGKELAAAPEAEYGCGPAGAAPDQLDEQVRSTLAGVTQGMSIASLWLAGLDWALHLAVSPGKVDTALGQWVSGAIAATAGMWPGPAAAQPTPGVPAPPADLRFADPAWLQWPYRCWRDAFHNNEALWEALTRGLPGVSPHHERLVSFCARQVLDTFSPGNAWWLNPVVLQATTASGGANLLDGACHWQHDMQNVVADLTREPKLRRPPAFKVGQDVAATPGKVVFRNALIELIQYAPAGAEVWREPVLIVPSWIMKYYILDLQPHDSMVRYLVEQGHTVFMISWKNPGAEARDLGLADYLRLGVLAALHAVQERCPDTRIHAAGYCLGGTLLSICAAALSRDGSGAPLQSLTVFASETDFSEPGELGLFIDSSALSALDAMMRRQGYLDGPQMAAAFQMLHSRDLVWSRMMSEYLLGKRLRPNDLESWNRDLTRLPFRMHSECLHKLFLDNDLAEGRYCVDGRPVALSDIGMPIFAVGTEHDHVSPWRSVYKLHLLTPAPLTFLLTSGGHNAGIVSEPSRPGRRYRVATRAAQATYVSPERYLANAQRHDGSWWPCWHDWLASHSTGRVPARDAAPGALADAPGSYVLER